MKKFAVITRFLSILLALVLLVNTFIIDMSSAVLRCVDKAIQGDLPLRDTYVLSDIAQAPRPSNIDVGVQILTYANIPAGASLAPELEALLGQDSFTVEETPNGVKHVYGHGLVLRFQDGSVTYKMLLRYQPDLGYRQALENIRVENGCAVPSIQIRARLRYMLDKLGIENDMIDKAQIVIFQYNGSPTQRAADGGYAPLFLSVSMALSFFSFDRESTLPPTAANADRWAQ
jgi:hypothetical protein